MATQNTSYPELSSLIFGNSTNSDFNKILGDIKRSTLSIPNRLRSIQQDADFIAKVASLYDLPLVANERCGSWYIDPERKVGSAYFKSTDGHMQQWSFSLRRLNLQILDIVGKYGGCIIVDSTRRGKSMPDALSKTIPIWIAVMNRILFPDQPDCHDLKTPPTVVGASEHAQMAERIPSFVESLKTLNLDLSSLRNHLKKPLRPIWITQNSPLPPSTPTFPSFTPIILLTASRRVPGGEASENNYIQGAADDAEAWSIGLTAPLFWKHSSLLLSTPEEDLKTLITRLRQESLDAEVADPLTLVTPTRNIYIGTLKAAEAFAQENDIIVTVSATKSSALSQRCKKHLHLALPEGKVGSRQLRHQLPGLLPFLKQHLSSETTTSSSSLQHPRIIIADLTGKDQSIGVTLAILCLCITDSGSLKSIAEMREPPVQGLNKQVIKQRLSWVSVVRPDANPSRTTLQSVNAFLLG